MTANAPSPSVSSAVTPKTSGTRVVALVGNPNTGKTALFNALTGYRRHVANYPGVTVETASGPIRGATQPLSLLDLPGTYSLAPVSPDEIVATDVLFGRAEPIHKRPDAIIAIVDASNLERNFYLVTQLLELGVPIVIALNMIDIAARRGIRVDCERLAERLGVPVVPVIATQKATVAPLVGAVERALEAPPPEIHIDLPLPLMQEAGQLRRCGAGMLCGAESMRILQDRDGHAEQAFLARGGSYEDLSAARQRLTVAGCTSPADEVRARYAWIRRVLTDVVHRPPTALQTWSDRIDRVLTHKLAGGLILVLVLAGVFQAIYQGAAPLMHFISDTVFGNLAVWVGALLPAGVLHSLIVDGVIAGVGGVLVFLPQILILFGLIAILEDCGYMARAAYMMDRLMRGLGLSGRAFIPLLSSFACAVPAIMGTRAISDRRERFVTILIAPFMSCSARLPVYTLIIGAFVPGTTFLGGWLGLQGLVMLGMYLVGVMVAIPVAWLLKATVFAGPQPPFFLELPSYKRPRLRAVLQRMIFAGQHFIVRAGTVILLVNLIVWALAYFPHAPQTAAAVQAQATAEQWDADRAESELSGAYLRESYLGRVGRAIEPVIRPLGWDWKIGMAVVASFPAREVVIATLGTIYNLGADVDEQSLPLQEKLKDAKWKESGAPIFTLPVALSLMVFFALCAQCSSTLVVIGRETRSWVWPIVSFVGMTTLAYVGALVTMRLATVLM